MEARDREQDEADVLVLGAGMAGLAAARGLCSAGYRVLVLEAENRVGGRIFTQTIDDEVVELGAEFVHGRPPQLLALIAEAGLVLVEREGTPMRYQDGTLRSDYDQSRDQKPDSDPSAVLEKLKGYSGVDLSFAEFLAQKEFSEETRKAAIGFVEGFNAADHRAISIAALGVQQEAEDAIEGERMFHVAGGYDQLPKFLAAKVQEAGGRILLNTRALRLEWEEGRALVVAQNSGHQSDGREMIYSARRVVVALPLGVLQRGQPDFHPALPERIRQVLETDGTLRMGSALRFTLLFKERFWAMLLPQPQLGELGFLFTPESMPPVWWTPHPEASHAITGWIGGPRGAAWEGLSSEAVAERACETLAKAFNVDVAYVLGLLRRCAMHDWTSDPSSAGAYSYVAKGGIEAPNCFQEPVAATIYFAGEHTTTDGHWGTVHAALSSGLRVAKTIMAEHAANALNVVPI